MVTTPSRLFVQPVFLHQTVSGAGTELALRSLSFPRLAPCLKDRQYAYFEQVTTRLPDSWKLPCLRIPSLSCQSAKFRSKCHPMPLCRTECSTRPARSKQTVYSTAQHHSCEGHNNTHALTYCQIILRTLYSMQPHSDSICSCTRPDTERGVHIVST
jgi:hypothetical protein